MDPITIAILGLLLIAVIIVIIVIVRTTQFGIEFEDVPAVNLPEVEGESVAQRIGLAIQIKTLSDVEADKIDPAPFEAFRDLLRTLYPQLEEKLTRELINRHALLYTWQGSDPSLNPVCFMAHQDVVPADEGVEGGWTHPPFAGELADGYVWGRGALDCKGSLICTLEAVNNLVKAGYQPKRTIYLAFGHDEENSGIFGAKQIAQTLKERGVKLSYLMDEGGTITTGQLKGIDGPVAFIGISEKGHLTLKLKARVKGGHSSMPPATTAIGALSLAIATLESNPFPQKLDIAQFVISHLGNATPFIQRMALANSWLFGGIVRKQLAANPSTNSITRTTAVPTVIRAGEAENVLPSEAEALINCRIFPGETVQEVYEYIRDLVSDDVVSVEPVYGETLLDHHAWNPTAVADIESPQYNRLADLVLGAFPGVKVAPFMMSGATDSRYYNDICQNAFRFTPFFLTKEEVATVHGVNERLSFVNAGRAVGFYQRLIVDVSSITKEQEGQEHEGVPGEELPVSKEEKVAISRMKEPLATKPLQSVRPAVKESSSKRNQTRKLAEDQVSDTSPEEDLPLEVKPLKKTE